MQKEVESPDTPGTEGAVIPPPDPRVSSTDQLMEEIVRGLYQGRFAPGQKLVEAELAKRYAVGRGTVREALRRLAIEGLVVLSLHRGASIRALSREDARSISEILEYLAGLAARLAAERIEPGEAAELTAMMASLRRQAEAGDSFEFARMRNRFYRLLIAYSRNGELARLLPLVEGHLLRTQFRDAYAVDAEKARLDVYQGVIDAVVSHDADAAERVMRRHIRSIAEHVETLPDEFFA